MLYSVGNEATYSFTPLMIVLVLAFAVPILLSRLRQIPVVVGEIVAGLIVGGSVLGLVHEDSILALMGDIGLAFLMFLAGMEIDFNLLFGNGARRKSKNSNPLFLALISYAVTLLLAGTGAVLLNRLGIEANPWLLTFILSATSLGVLLPILKERDLMRTPFGQAVFLNATFADFVTVILLTVYLIVQARGLDPEIFSIGLLFILFLLASRFGPSITRIPRVRRLVEELSRATVQIKVRGAIAILLAFVVLAEMVDAELILGAFLAGMVISLIKSPQDESLIHNLEAFGFGFFIPVFFILVGVNLDLSTLRGSTQALITLPALFIASLVIKLIPMAVFLRSLTWREALSGGILLNTHLSLEIAIAIVGVRSGLLSPAASTAITLFAVLTVLLMPVLFNALAPAKAPTKSRAIGICGAGQEALAVARELTAHGEEVVLFNEDPTVLEKATQAGLKTVLVNREAPFSSVSPESLKGFAAICSDDDLNLSLCKSAVAAGIQPVVAQVTNPARLGDFRIQGIQPFVPGLAQTVLLALLVRNPDVYTLLTSTSDDRDVREVTVHNANLSGRRLRDLRLPGEVLVLSIRRGEEFIIPHGNVEIELLDRLTMLGCYPDLAESEAILS